MPNIEEAIEALLAYQQADMEGIMVLTSRQAIHEVTDEIKRLRVALEAIRDRIWTDGEPYDERIGDLKWLATEVLRR